MLITVSVVRHITAAIAAVLFFVPMSVSVCPSVCLFLSLFVCFCLMQVQPLVRIVRRLLAFPEALQQHDAAIIT